MCWLHLQLQPLIELFFRHKCYSRFSVYCILCAIYENKSQLSVDQLIGSSYFEGKASQLQVWQQRRYHRAPGRITCSAHIYREARKAAHNWPLQIRWILCGSETKTENRRMCVFCRCSASMKSITDGVSWNFVDQPHCSSANWNLFCLLHHTK